MKPSFEDTYPCITAWVAGDGWIELGSDETSRSLVRALDTGGLVWEGQDSYSSMDEAFQDLEKGLARFMEREGLNG